MHLAHSSSLKAFLAPLVLLVLALSAGPVLAQPNPPSTADAKIALERVRLEIRRDALRKSNRRWSVPAIGLGLGAGSLIAGGVVFSLAWNGSSDGAGDEYNVAMDRTGLILMPTGAALVIASTPMLIIRLSRAMRLRRAERALKLFEQHFSLVPEVSGQRRGFAMRFRF